MPRILYAEDRDLIPTLSDPRARALYEAGYAVGGLHGRLLQDAALNPDTMDERFGAWGQLLALFAMIHDGSPDKRTFIIRRGGKLFDPQHFPFLTGQRTHDDPIRVPRVSDGCVLRILDGLLTIRDPKTKTRQRLSYRTLDVEQIGSVYETVMGFTIQRAVGRSLAIKAGKNNKTPVFADLDVLAHKKKTERAKYLKDVCNRAGLPAAVERAVKAAVDADGLAAALDPIVDERASPGKTTTPPGAPILQPTKERRRTGSHYTPRALTEPIVRHALAPAFARLGPDARPDEVLALKICDPAMGSGAFLVEACRHLAERLVAAWARRPKTRPTIPLDEDEALHARRLVAQRCLYGVDKNPMAVDLARLSLWLATLAREHEFAFLDHALKCGDSLVGLTRAQIAAAHWDLNAPPMALLGLLLKERVGATVAGRREIQEAPDDVTREIQESRFRVVEGRLDLVRLYGDAVIAAFFSADKPRARLIARGEAERHLLAAAAEGDAPLRTSAATLRDGEFPITPFHWEIEFPEVFARDTPGFDAIIGNPPFAGKNTIINSHRDGFLDWLKTAHEGAHGNADLVAHFFRRAFTLLRRDGTFGLIATNTIGQGDTRATGLTAILKAGGVITHAVKRLKWPGDAAVVVSVVHVRTAGTGAPAPAILDGRPAQRISAYLVEGDLDDSPAILAANAGKAFQGFDIMGVGFTFDDDACDKGRSLSFTQGKELQSVSAAHHSRIHPFIGGREINDSPEHSPKRLVIDMNDLSEEEARLRFPDLVAIIEKFVHPFRRNQKRKHLRECWWKFNENRPGLREATRNIDNVLVICQNSSTFGVSIIGSEIYPSHKLIAIAIDIRSFSFLQSRVHEVWAWFFGSTLKDDLVYTIKSCFLTLPFPHGWESEPTLEAMGRDYCHVRAKLMQDRQEGLTKTYNRFHDRAERSADIVRLRELHAAMDDAVLRAYGWDDLADRAAAKFLDESNEDEYAYQGRLFWPGAFRDEVLARLLALNAERHAEERRLGLVSADGKVLRRGGAGDGPDENGETDDADEAAA